MNKKNVILTVLLSSIIFTILFHKQSLGLNLFIYETILLIWFIVSKQIKFIFRTQIICSIGLILTSIFTVVTHSAFSIFINFVALFIFVGILIYPEVKSLVNTIRLSSSTIIFSQGHFFKQLFRSKFKGQSFGSYIWKYRIFLIPILIIIFFIIIYRFSNPVFNNLMGNVGEIIQKGFNSIFYDFDVTILFTFILGLILSNFILLRVTGQGIIKDDLNSIDELRRFKKKFRLRFNFMALKNEYKAAVFLLIILNLIILILNVIDIYWVWFNFEWQGQYLKQFVHEGTYLLILSIIISLVLVLYFFRNNLNFYSKNNLLKYLSYIWLVQNGILTISVAIRNFWYIHYFSLAYKRIGVIIFLILTIYGLYTVFVKVRKRKSSFYIFKSNTLALYIVLVISSFFNWDGIIAKYNFNHAEKSFLHLNYLSTLTDKTLPYLDKPLSELIRIDKIQKGKFPFEEIYMTPERYYEIIENRKISFKEDWESKSIFEWNLPEYLAYTKLFAKDKAGQ